MIVKIDVTDEDIDNGDACNVMKCMVARSLKRYIQGKRIYVYRDLCYIVEIKNSSIIPIPIPAFVSDKIKQFDNWKTKLNTPRPMLFSFEMDIPVRFLRVDVPHFKEDLVTC